MSFEVHREPLYRRYYAGNFSSACCYFILFSFVLVFLPLIIAYNSSEFWVKESIFYEQPKVQFKYDVLLQLHGMSDGLPFKLFYSTSPAINQLYESSLRIPVVQSAEFDDNRDGLCDRIELDMQMPISVMEEITSIKAILFHDVTLSSQVKYTFDAISFIAYESSSAISHFTSDGDLLLHQSWPLSTKGGFKAPYRGHELLSVSPSISTNDVSFASILSRSASRNLSLAFSPRYQLAQSFNAVATSDRTARFCNISIVERILNQPVRYSPSVSEVLKYAWIQYIAFFAVISFLLFRLNSFIFKHQLVYTHAAVDVVMEKME